MCKASLRLAEKNEELLKQCESFSITCFRDTAAYLDENYKVVRPSIIWLDQRQARLKEKLPFGYNFLFSLVGMHNTILFNRRRTPAHWLKENEPENWAKIKYYVPLSSYFNKRLINVLGDGPSNMIGHYPINFKKGKWYPSYKALKACIFGIPMDRLPTIYPTGSVIGAVTEQAHLETGLPVGLKFITTGNDKSCEGLGCGAVDETVAHISYGTASTASIVSKKYFEPAKFLPSYVSAYPGWFSGESQVYRGYWMLDWFLKQFGQQETIEAEIEKVVPEQVLNKKLAEIPPGSNGLIVQPYWGASLERPLAKGSIIGFYDVHTKYHIYRAIIEGIAYALKEGLLLMPKRITRRISKISISGGGSRSDAICQITADIFNLPVIKTSTEQSCALGCAMAQFVANKVFKDVNEAEKAMVKISKTFYPNKEAVIKYRYLFNNVYVGMYPELKKSYKNLSEYLMINDEGTIH